MAEILDQEHTGGTNNAGFGEWAGVRYRGMGFKPSLASMTALSFQINSVGSRGMKVYIDTADADSLPSHAVGSEVYSFVITNANLSATLNKYTLPAELVVTPEAQYCYYLAPWNTTTDVYADDYRDAKWKNSNGYARGKPIVFANWSGSAFAVGDGGNLDANFRTYGNEASTFVPKVIHT